MKKPIVLCILDGIGIGKDNQYNAVYLAKTPTLDYLKKNYSHSRLKCGGRAVGLPENQMGNSEVGHLNIGAGRVVYQSLTLINSKIEDKSFFKNESLLAAINHAKKNNSKLHLMGLLSDGGVHSHIDHLKALLKLCKINNFNNVYVHAFMDGRDTLRDSGIEYVKDIIKFMNEEKIGQIASISGRYYAMDRDKRFERNKLAYDVMVNNSNESYEDELTYLQKSYDSEVFDEFILPAYNKNLNVKISDNDSVICFNFRPDRSIQISSLLTNPDYSQVFDNQPKNLFFVSMMRYDKSVIASVAFEHEKIKNVLGVYLANNNLNQLRIAETEKYAHVTFFLDGQVKYDGKNNPELKNCTRILVDSPKVATYDLKPEMSAIEITNRLIEELDKDYLDVVILNYANGDMVGHTGNISAAIKAVECVDTCLGRVYKKVKEIDGILIVSADHGNSDEMRDSNNKVLTAHSLNDVIFLITKKDIQVEDGKLSDIAPTILDLLNMEQPKEMSGHSLIKKGE